MTDQPFLPTRAPRRNHETAEFWDGCAADRFLLPRCDACGEHIWYPRRTCPFCGSREVHAHEVSGAGTVYSFSVVRRGQGPWRDAAPYVLAMVTLAEGPTLMTNLIDVDPAAVTVGMPVHVVFEPVADSTDQLYRFTPDR